METGDGWVGLQEVGGIEAGDVWVGFQEKWEPWQDCFETILFCNLHYSQANLKLNRILMDFSDDLVRYVFSDVTLSQYIHHTDIVAGGN